MAPTPRPKARRRRWRTLAAALLGALALAALATTPAARRGHEALLILFDIQAGTGPSRLKHRTRDPLRSAVDFRILGRDHQADRYQPADRAPRATLVLLHGLTPAGRREPRLERFATTLARAGFRVVVPDLPGMRSLAVGTEDVRDIADTLRQVLGRTGNPDCNAVGLMGFSFAVGPALIAALTADVGERLSFVVAVGGYYDLTGAITYATTGYDPLSGQRGTPPAPEGKWWLLQSESRRLTRLEDRALLDQLAQRRTRDPAAPVDDLLVPLSRDGRAVYALAANTDPERVRDLIRQLPAEIRTQLHALDLAQQKLETLRAHLLLIHGTEDNVIPVGHSRALLARLGTARASLFEAGGLNHVDVAPGLRDAFQLWRATRELLWLADGGAREPAC
ncbi:MAG: alpha/beta hydrolase family protein [Porticoccaceae bacterium]